MGTRHSQEYPQNRHDSGRIPEGLPADSPTPEHTPANRYPKTNGFPGALKRFETPHEMAGGRFGIRVPVTARLTAVYGPLRTVAREEG
jgi:hypothetical protein